MNKQNAGNVINENIIILNGTYDMHLKQLKYPEFSCLS